MARAYVCMKISEYPPWDGDAHWMNISVWKTHEESKQRFQRKAHVLLNKEGPTVRPHVLVQSLWNSTMLSLTNICVHFWRS